jgi:hypothetical protein
MACYIYRINHLGISKSYWAGDVGITLRVPDISVPPLAQLGAHEDCPKTKAGPYVGSNKRDLPEDGLLTNKARRHS